MMNPKKLAVVALAAPALLIAIPAVASADTGYRDCTSTVSEQAGAEGAVRALGRHCTEANTVRGSVRRSLLARVVGGLL